jgi:hypothetical protein
MNRLRPLRIFLIQSIHEAAVSLSVAHPALFRPVEKCRLQTAQGIKTGEFRP